MTPGGAANFKDLRRMGEPIMVGLPLPRGLVDDPARLSMHRPGAAIPLQSRALDRWPDGSLRWVLLDFKADAVAGEVTTYHLQVQSEAPTDERPGISASEGSGSVTVETGTASFRLLAGGAFPFEQVLVDGDSLIDLRRSGLQVQDDTGRPCAVHMDRVSIEESGTLRTVVLASGHVARATGERLVDVRVRLHFFAGSATVKFALTVTNPRRAVHPGGLWNLGDRGSAYIKDLALAFALEGTGGPPDIRWSPEPSVSLGSADGDLELYQDSSGGEHWRSSNHLNREHRVSTTFRGYRVRTSAGERNGLRATPVVSINSGSRQLTVAVPRFWENFPKAIEASGDSIVLRLYPQQYADVHELQGGEQKTHTFFVAFGPDGVTEQPLAWCLAPLLARADPEWYSSSGALPYLIPAAQHSDREYVQLVNMAIDGPDTFTHKREVIDEYGWRHFGDIYGDHEGVSVPTDRPPLVSHYNNQYDPIAGFAYQFAASGDPRWHDAMDDLAAHVIDIDIYHTTRDKSAYNHGLFWHTYHYVDADTATHRSYPAASRAIVKGGGPSAEQNYATGLMLHYFLTGNEASRQTAIDLAQFVVDIDDGRKTIVRWLDRGATGLATASGSLTYHGPGRACANSLSVLIDGHRLSGDDRFMAKAEEIVRRCIHPSDDIAARDLLDVERKWFYTMCLQSLGKYLDYKIERNELDSMYAYGRESLLHYARWMTTNERPYLDKPEILEYPTETWPAQDMRKSEVFKYAAKHAAGDERSAFLERSDFFFRYSVTTLRSMSTRSFARPVVILLTNGLMHAYFQKHPGLAAPEPAQQGFNFGDPQSFTPQRIRAVRRFRLIAGAALVMAVVITGWLVIRWL
jgi:hypothetical protein